jgi:tetratricopeptide (TPR) repeat protein
MDLQDFEAQALYFEDPLPECVETLLQEAAAAYGSEDAERRLLQAYFLEPGHLTVLVALYRYFYYRHRYQDALLVAERAMAVSGSRLGLRTAWQDLTLPSLGPGILRSMTLTRFYLMALKGAGYLLLRSGDIRAGLARLEKVTELDTDDRLGVRALVQVARRELQRQDLQAYANVVSMS